MYQQETGYQTRMVNYRVMISRAANGWVIEANNFQFVVQHDGSASLDDLLLSIENIVSKLEKENG